MRTEEYRIKQVVTMGESKFFPQVYVKWLFGLIKYWDTYTDQYGSIVYYLSHHRAEEFIENRSMLNKNYTIFHTYKPKLK